MFDTVQSRYSERKYSEQSRFSEPFAVSHFIKYCYGVKLP